MATDAGRSGADAPSGHSAEPEPSCTVSAAGAVSVPNARELWRSGCDSYPDIVFVTESGDIGMKADLGRAVVRSVGQWCYLATEAKRLSAGFSAFPRDVAAILSKMGDDDGVLSAATIADETGIPAKRVNEIQRALRVLGLANFGVLCDSDSDAYVARGSGYWSSLTGEQLSYALHAAGIEAENAVSA